jgi:uncharacterized integral membrane protein (TIGR00698 family)
VGLLLCLVISVASEILARVEKAAIGYAVIEPLVLALLLGLAVRAVWDLRGAFPARAKPGITYAGKGLLEFAIVLLGAGLNLRELAGIGPSILGAIVLSVSMAIVVGTLIGRAAGLPSKLAVLVAVGNAVCGNSAIAAVAPVIRAKQRDVASAIALTAVLGIGVVLTLPLLIPIVGLSHAQYGVLAGLTVYAVPQVLAATYPVSIESGQVGTLVKLGRVVLLGPVVAIFGLIYRNERDEDGVVAQKKFSLNRFLPLFVIGFLLLSVLRTTGAIPASIGDPSKEASRILTVVAMAGLGAGVQLSDVRKTGARVALVVLALLALLITLALVMIHVLSLGA